MKRFNKLNYLRPGAVSPQGFLKEQLQRCKNGLGGHLDELEPSMIRDPFIKRTRVEAWTDENQEGWGAEISGNYHTGLMGLAYTLDDEELKNKASSWAEALLTRQCDDGYMGTYDENKSNIFDDYNAWGTACGMRALLLYYYSTGKEYVLDAVYRCMLWFCDNWSGNKKTLYAGIYIVEIMVACYIKKHDERLIKFCEDYYEFLEKKGVFFNSIGKYLSDTLPYNSHHTAGLCSQIKLPALLYMATGNEKYLRASENMVKKLRRKSVQESGGAVCNTEYIGPCGALSETEYCAYTFLDASYSDMLMVTGNAKYGEYMEELFYNGAQGARKKDEKAIAYMTAPNQIFATETSSPIFGDVQVYAPCYPTSCCPVNSVVILPEFIRAMAMTDEDKNVYINIYGPCHIETDTVSLQENTLYPFRNNVEFVVTKGALCEINFRIPSWSKKTVVSVDGKEKSFTENNGYLTLEDNWKEGTVISIEFFADVRVIKIDDTDNGGHFPLAFKYGALLFSMPIPEKWLPTEGRPMTALPEGWNWYNVEPEIIDDSSIDTHDVLGYRKEIISWNVSVDENISSENIKVENIDNEGYAWSNPLIRLSFDAYKSPDAFPPYLSKTMEPYGDKQPVTHKVSVSLVPYGCTNLRITYFPRADV